MSNEHLYKYLSAKSKERELPIESLPELFEFSRSSLYRYMKGISRMSVQVQAEFVRVFKLDEGEQQEFRRLVGLSEFDSTMLDARQALDSFVFDNQRGRVQSELTKFAYYESDVFLRTSDEISEQIYSLVANKDAECIVRITGCMAPEMINWVSSFLKKLFSSSDNISVEHLLTFSEKNYLHNANTLINIIALLKYQSYLVLHSEETLTSDVNSLFKNTLLIEIRMRASASRYFCISMLDDGLSTCLSTSDKNVFAFFNKNYEALKVSYHAALLDASNFDIFGSQLAELTLNANCYILKPNCCYDLIPISVYHSLMSRLTPQELEGLQIGIRDSIDASERALDDVLAVLEKRIAASYKNHHIDVNSLDGLSQFARTGRTTDHFDFLPSFSKEERRTVLEYIKKRSIDLNDKYQLFLTRKAMLEKGYIIVTIEGIGIIIEYDQDDYRQGICSNLFIRNKMLADIFSDYIKNHIPNNHVLTTEETTAFLDSLIASLS